MAIPAVPSQIVLQTGNGSNLISWPLVPTATSYSVQRSIDGVTFSTVGTPATNLFVDSAVTVGALYYYKVASTNISGTSAYAASFPVNIVPCLPGQINLGYLRYLSQLRADKLNSQFLTTDEWNSNINQSMYELYDILITKFGDQYFLAAPVVFGTTGASSYPLPDGVTNIGGTIPPALYKLAGVDCGVAVGNNAWVTLPRFNWIDRNRFIYPQLQANALGVFNLSYSAWQNNLYFIPRPAGGQFIQLWYIPILNQLLQDTDMLTFSISGWSELIIVDAAIKALLKEESFDQAAALTSRKAALLERIETTAANRDVGQPNTISDTRSNTGFYDGGGFGGNGSGMAGWLAALLPLFSPSDSIHNIGNGLLTHPILLSQHDLACISIFMFISYFCNKLPGQFGGRIEFSGARYACAPGVSSFLNHIGMIFSRSSCKKMIGIYAKRVVTMMTNAYFGRK